MYAKLGLVVDINFVPQNGVQVCFLILHLHIITVRVFCIDVRTAHQNLTLFRMQCFGEWGKGEEGKPGGSRAISDCCSRSVTSFLPCLRPLRGPRQMLKLVAVSSQQDKREILFSDLRRDIYFMVISSNQPQSAAVRNEAEVNYMAELIDDLTRMHE